VAADGGIFPFGDALGHGSAGAFVVDVPFVGMAATELGRGYWLATADGNISRSGMPRASGPPAA